MNLHDTLCRFVAGRNARGATLGEALAELGEGRVSVAAAWDVLTRSGYLVATGGYRQVGDHAERVYTVGPGPTLERYNPNEPRDPHGRWTTGGAGAGTGAGAGVTADTAESLIASIHDTGGFTFDPRTGGLVKVGSVKGVAVAVPHTEQIVGRGANVDRAEFISGVADVIQKHGEAMSKGAMLGGWFSEDRQVYMVELTELIPDRKAAIALGKQRNQEGVFDLGTGEYIPTGGTGG